MDVGGGGGERKGWMDEIERKRKERREKGRERGSIKYTARTTVQVASANKP